MNQEVKRLFKGNEAISNIMEMDDRGIAICLSGGYGVRAHEAARIFIRELIEAEKKRG